MGNLKVQPAVKTKIVFAQNTDDKCGGWANTKKGNPVRKGVQLEGSILG